MIVSQTEVELSIHLPKLDTSEGILQVLTLCNYSRLSTAFHPDVYTAYGIHVHPTEHAFLTHLRKKSKELISYPESWLEITDDDARAIPLSSVERLYALQQLTASPCR
jgi:hypothetical protein